MVLWVVSWWNLVVGGFVLRIAGGSDTVLFVVQQSPTCVCSDALLFGRIMATLPRLPSFDLGVSLRGPVVLLVRLFISRLSRTIEHGLVAEICSCY